MDKLVLGLIHQLILGDPRHHAPELGAHFLDRMFGFAPPLIITEAEIDEMVSIFGDSVAAVRGNKDIL